MSDPFMSQIEAFAFNFAPRGWLMCTGQTLPINQYQALFALLGTTFGGNGVSTFMLPDLRSRVAIGFGSGAGLPVYDMGETAGQENVTLTTATMPATSHTHALNASNATGGGVAAPGTAVVLSSGYTATIATPPVTAPQPIYATVAPTTPMGSLTPVGGQPHNNLMPTLGVNYCIAISGVFPSRG
jgi:microcystin-dependent protein